MPWLETNPMDQRSRFIDAYLSGMFTKTELCARFHISRRLGDKWIARYDGGSIQTGARRSCSIGCGRGTRASTGQRRVPRVIC